MPCIARFVIYFMYSTAFFVVLLVLQAIDVFLLQYIYKTAHLDAYHIFLGIPSTLNLLLCCRSMPCSPMYYTK